MKRTDKILAALAVALWSASGVACASRVRPGVGVSNDGQRVGLDLGTYDTSFAHPVTGVAPGDECPGGVCGVPDPVVQVRKSQIDAVREAVKTPPWVYPTLIVVGLGIVAGVIYIVRGGKR